MGVGAPRALPREGRDPILENLGNDRLVLALGFDTRMHWV